MTSCSSSSYRCLIVRALKCAPRLSHPPAVLLGKEERMEALVAEPTRFVGLDVHKTYVMVAAVDARQTVVLPPRRVSMIEFADWAKAHCTPSGLFAVNAR